ncbi:MAG: metallophosphoesterase [Lachnospiraceae bacterium]
MNRAIYFSVYFILNFYIIWRTYFWADHCFSQTPLQTVHIIYAVTWMAFACSLILSHFLQHRIKWRKLHIFSSYYFGVFFYAIFYLLLSDIAMLICVFFGLLPFSFFLEIPVARGIGMANLTLILLTSIYGSIHVRVLKLVKNNIFIHKSWQAPSLKIALVADFHLGYNIGVKEIERMVSHINKENVDLVCIVGDIFDNNFSAIKNPKKVAGALRKLNATYGVYGCWGNHDVEEMRFAGFCVQDKHQSFRTPEMEHFMKKSHVTMLADEVVTIADNSIYIIGRKDSERAGDGTRNRLSLEDLMTGVSKDKPIIVLDHSPKTLDEEEKLEVDLVLSGHTHKGQFFPMNYTNFLVFHKNHYGIITHGKTTSAVTSGIGVYGPKMRVGSDSEIMILNVSFCDTSHA